MSSSQQKTTLRVICVVAMVMGVWALAGGVRHIAFELQDATGASLTEPERQSVQQIRTILGPWRPVQLGLIFLSTAAGALLAVAGTAAFRLYPIGRRLLAVAILFTLVIDALTLAWFLVANAAIFDVYVRHARATLEALPHPSGPPKDPRAMLASAFVAAVAMRLVKIGVEAAAWRYVRSDEIAHPYPKPRPHNKD